MSRFKDFDAARAEAHGEPLTFVLGGEMFTATGELPAGVLLDLGRAVAADNTLLTLDLLQEFFEAIVGPDDVDRFAKAVRRVGLETVQALLEWIVEESTGRPFTTASSSPLPRVPDGATSKVEPVSWAAEVPSR
jgi:hypothetical protein